MSEIELVMLERVVQNYFNELERRENFKNTPQK
jgi:hypothetical protein